MENDKALVTFENQKVRRHFDETEECWYFSVIDVVAVLTGSVNPRDYWFKMKIRVESEDGIELSTICRQLKIRNQTENRSKKQDHPELICRFASAQRFDNLNIMFH
jgi:hypothetical protein